jgi:hypothetical protein
MQILNDELIGILQRLDIHVRSNQEIDKKNDKGVFMNTDRYNGWENRETWAAFLWITNELRTYNHFKNLAKDGEVDVVASALSKYFDDANAVLAENLGAREQEFASVTPHIPISHLYFMLSDVGSLWRVNWSEVANAICE